MDETQLKKMENLTKEMGIKSEIIAFPYEEPIHSHPYFSMTYVMRGTCRQIIHGREFIQNPGTLSCIPSGFSHRLIIDSDAGIIRCKLNSDLFRSLSIPDMLSFLMPVIFACGEDSFVKDTICRLHEQQQKTPMYHDVISTCLFTALFAYALQKFRETATFIYLPEFEESFTWEMLRFAFNNYSTVTLRSLSQHFHYSESYICRVFRTKYHVTFTHLIKQFRMQRAADMLKETPVKVSEACEAVGYRDVSQFIKDFQKQFAVTPGKYKKQANHL